MGFLKNLFTPDAKRHQDFPESFLDNPEPWLIEALTGANFNQEIVSVNERTALNLSALYACLKIRSETFASFPIELIERDKDGNEKLALDHYLFSIMNAEPNEAQSSFIWKQTSMVNIDVSGNSYFRIRLNARRTEVESLEIIDKRVTPRLIKGKVWYELENEKEYLPQGEVLHFMNFSLNGYMGINPIRAQKETLSLGLNAQAYGINYYKNGSHLGGVLESDSKPPPDKREEATDNLLKGWHKRMRGIGKSGGTGVLWAGFKYKKIRDNIKDSMLLDVRDLTVPDIARAYRVPLPLILQIQAGGQIKQEQIMLMLSHSMLPAARMYEEELNRKLLSKKEKGRLFFRFNMDALLRADTEALTARLRMMYDTQSINHDEIRKEFGYGPRLDGKGKMYGNPLASNVKTEAEEKKKKSKQKTDSEESPQNS